MGFLLPSFDAATERRFDVWRTARLLDALPVPISIGAASLFAFLYWDWMLDPGPFWWCFGFRATGAGIMLAVAWRVRFPPQPSLLPIALLSVSAGTGAIAASQFMLTDGFMHGPAGLAVFPTVSAILVTRARLIPLVNLPGLILVLVLLMVRGIEGFVLFNVLSFLMTGVFAAYILAHTLERTARYGFQLELQLEEQAHLDPLTGIANRRRLEDQGRLEVERANRFGRALSLMILDLDHFKGVNDRFGHPFGDRVLRHLAGLGSENLRQTDLFARVGGEEFVVLLPETPANAAAALGERLRAALRDQPLHQGEMAVPVTISIGIAAYGPANPTLEQMLEAADRALYVAKAEGRDRVVIAGTPG